MSEIRYHLGYHESWEVYRHSLVQEAKDKNEEIEKKRLDLLTDNWIRRNNRRAHLEAPCPWCQDEIAESKITGVSCFAIPAQVKQVLRATGRRGMARLL